ncbi:uncharacterized protein [Coffea arabica]|uniref:RNase H type-1 domain-containing protein n=1 Tax=Coffea arabica TaxID=13443 RepID=A0ABM4V304_COFAR
MSDNYRLAQELISNVGKKYRGRNVVLKLDMIKAYDRMSWVFVLKVLRQFGFGERFVDMMWRLLSNVWFSVIVNSVSHGYKVPRHYPAISHLAFADEVIVFANGSASSLRKIMRVLELYQCASGQLVNTSKSGSLIHPSVSLARKNVIERITKFSKREFPVYYLGSPLFTGQCKGAYFADLCQQIVDKARNSAVFEGITKNTRSICGAVFQNLKDAYWLQFGEFQQVMTCPQFLGLVERRAEVFRIRLVHWQSPVFGTLKLNIDGCSKGNPGLSGGRGILRDVLGSFIFAFAGCFGYGTSLQAEAKVLLLGLQLCVQRKMIRQLVVESDTRLLI